MEKKVLLVIFLMMLLMCGCIDGKTKVYYKGIKSAEIPLSCSEYKDDVCGLYDCMVDQCWCDDGHFPSPILYEPEDVLVNDTQDAIEVVQSFMDENPLEYENYSITNAVQMNTVFYTVFLEDASFDEISFTVAVDGIILKTICGV